MGTSFYAGLNGKPGRGLICRGPMCGRRFWDGSLHIGSPLGDLGLGVRLPGTLRDG
jgi:hypothetical protein